MNKVKKQVSKSLDSGVKRWHLTWSQEMAALLGEFCISSFLVSGSGEQKQSIQYIDTRICISKSRVLNSSPTYSSHTVHVHSSHSRLCSPPSSVRSPNQSEHLLVLKIYLVSPSVTPLYAVIAAQKDWRSSLGSRSQHASFCVLSMSIGIACPVSPRNCFRAAVQYDLTRMSSSCISWGPSVASSMWA